MIISHQHRYVFFAHPITGCSAIRRELVENYGGEEVLTKHATWNDFLVHFQHTSVSSYLRFTGIRHPLEIAYSYYVQVKTNKGRVFSNPMLRQGMPGGWVLESQVRDYQWCRSHPQHTYSDWIRYRWKHVVYTNLLGHELLSNMHVVIRHERIQSDFAAALESAGLRKLRDLPRFNPTPKKEESRCEYDSDAIAIMMATFGGEMQRQGYRFPESWYQRKARRPLRRCRGCVSMCEMGSPPTQRV